MFFLKIPANFTRSRNLILFRNKTLSVFQKSLLLTSIWCDLMENVDNPDKSGDPENLFEPGLTKNENDFGHSSSSSSLSSNSTPAKPFTSPHPEEERQQRPHLQPSQQRRTTTLSQQRQQVDNPSSHDHSTNISAHDHSTNMSAHDPSTNIPAYDPSASIPVHDISINSSDDDHSTPTSPRRNTSKTLKVNMSKLKGFKIMTAIGTNLVTSFKNEPNSNPKMISEDCDTLPRSESVLHEKDSRVHGQSDDLTFSKEKVTSHDVTSNEIIPANFTDLVPQDDNVPTFSKSEIPQYHPDLFKTTLSKDPNVPKHTNLDDSPKHKNQFEFKDVQTSLSNTPPEKVSLSPRHSRNQHRNQHQNQEQEPEQNQSQQRRQQSQKQQEQERGELHEGLKNKPLPSVVNTVPQREKSKAFWKLFGKQSTIGDFPKYDLAVDQSSDDITSHELDDIFDDPSSDPLKRNLVSHDEKYQQPTKIVKDENCDGRDDEGYEYRGGTIVGDGVDHDIIEKKNSSSDSNRDNYIEKVHGGPEKPFDNPHDLFEHHTELPFKNHSDQAFLKKNENRERCDNEGDNQVDFRTGQNPLNVITGEHEDSQRFYEAVLFNLEKNVDSWKNFQEHICRIKPNQEQLKMYGLDGDVLGIIDENDDTRLDIYANSSGNCLQANQLLFVTWMILKTMKSLCETCHRLETLENQSLNNNTTVKDDKKHLERFHEDYKTIVQKLQDQQDLNSQERSDRLRELLERLTELKDDTKIQKGIICSQERLINAQEELMKVSEGKVKDLEEKVKSLENVLQQQLDVNHEHLKKNEKSKMMNALAVSTNGERLARMTRIQKNLKWKM